MLRRFSNLAGLLLAVVVVLSARAQPTPNPFPTNSIEAKATLRASLQAIGSSFLNAIENRATLERLMSELRSRYRDVPDLDEIKRLLLGLDPAYAQQLVMTDPDRAPLQGTVFARQLLRGPNPDMQRIQEHTWPPDLSHGEKVALQAYSGSAFGVLNQELRTKGVVQPMYSLLHDRLQSAFRKARPFSPPVTLSRGVRMNPGPQTDNFLAPIKEAHKEGRAYTMRGYVSTTYGDRVHPGFQGNVHMHFKATHGIDVYPISLFPDEREVLLNHNSTFRVTDIRSEGGRWIINFEQIPPSK
ncbi:MAG TPA: ADP-ribosyltransferase [Gemmataceae bacterium]|nr:ADP-ribosyltransferase [Gemmataceae bacterium]